MIEPDDEGTQSNAAPPAAPATVAMRVAAGVSGLAMLLVGTLFTVGAAPVGAIGVWIYKVTPPETWEAARVAGGIVIAFFGTVGWGAAMLLTLAVTGRWISAARAGR